MGATTKVVPFQCPWTAFKMLLSESIKVGEESEENSVTNWKLANNDVCSRSAHWVAKYLI